VLEEGFLDVLKPLQIRFGDLPHWRQEGALYFVTFRLGDSLPQVLLDRWRSEQREWQTTNVRPSNELLLQSVLERQRQIESWLDRDYGSCILKDDAAKTIVEEAIRHFDSERYELGDFAVAPNHVHALLRTATGVDLSNVLYSWKRYTASALRQIPRLATPFQNSPHLWQRESFDHIVRNAHSLEKIRRYIQKHNEPRT